MISASSAFKAMVANGTAKHLPYFEITLADNTALTVDSSKIWQGTPSIEDAVSADSDLQLGTAIINRFTISLNNINGEYSSYDFTDAKVIAYSELKISASQTERLRKGTFTVDNAVYNGSIIELECLDNMSRFDRPFADCTISFPNTYFGVISRCCTDCGVSQSAVAFPYQSTAINTKPEGLDTATYREVVGWIAQMAGCFARCDRYGRLELKWYNETALTDAVTEARNGSKSYTNAHCIQRTLNHNISVDDVVISGVTVTAKRKPTSEDDSQTVTESRGTAGYRIAVTNNPFITPFTVSDIADRLATVLLGFTFRKANVSHLPDPTMEAGDVGIVWDRENNFYPIIISKTIYSWNRSQTTVSSAQTPARNSASRISQETKNYVDLRRQMLDERTARDIALEELSERLNEKAGLYSTVDDTGLSGNIYYLHDQPELEDSSVVWKMNAEAWGVTTQYNGEHPEQTVWNAGMTVDGDVIARILTATGINADWINTGAISIGKTVNGVYHETFYANADTGAVRIVADTFSLSSGETLMSVLDEAMYYADKNLLKGAYDFSETYWRVTGTLNGGQTDPNGGTKGFVLMCPSSGESGITALSNNKPFPLTPASYRISIWMKSSNRTAAANHPIGIYLNDTKVGEVSPTTVWKEYHFDTTVTSVSQVGWVNIGGGNTFTSASGWNCYIYNPRVEILTDTLFSKENIFNAITDNGANNGVFLLENGEMYISFTYAHGGTLKLGGNQNTNGTFEVLNSSGSRVVYIDNSGTIFRTPSTNEYIKINENIIQGYATSYGHLQSWIDMCANYATSGGQPLYWLTIETSSYSEGIKLIAGNNGSIQMDCGNTGVVDILSNVKIAKNCNVDGYINTTSYVQATDHIYTPGYVQCTNLTVTNPPWNSSDMRLKKNIRDAESPTKKIKKLKIREFDWKASGKHVKAGFVAQELQEVFPELVRRAEDGYLNVSYVGMVPYLVKTIQEMQEEIESLRKQVM